MSPMRSTNPIIIKKTLINPLMNQSTPLDVEDASSVVIPVLLSPVGIFADPPFTMSES